MPIEQPAPMQASDLLGIHAIYQAYDRAGQTAQQLFGDALGDHARIVAKYCLLRTGEEGIQALQEAAALNFAMADAHFKAGATDAARSFITDLLEEPALARLAAKADQVGVSYCQECVAAGKLLSPAELDARVFSVYFAKPNEAVSEYLDHAGLAVCVQRERQYQTTLLFDRLNLDHVSDGRRKDTTVDSVIGINGVDFTPSPDEADNEEFGSKGFDLAMRTMFLLHGILDPYVMQVASGQVAQYIMYRYMIHRGAENITRTIGLEANIHVDSHIIMQVHDGNRPG